MVLGSLWHELYDTPYHSLGDGIGERIYALMRDPTFPHFPDARPVSPFVCYFALIDFSCFL